MKKRRRAHRLKVRVGHEGIRVWESSCVSPKIMRSRTIDPGLFKKVRELAC